ncbi:P-loop NTPase family protein [Micromonospora craniellae]|uniref:Dynamin family protein n=1 Tax=Micromonospora craniellae TaxID=2294034 RepID=A0A372FXP5_9ACTN|nr:hypothetical protein [Micromonospora craniellae]QOC93266.1 hypothetical protein ID554_06165 [Micromonospora craniellae]RFS45394.1 hypothetical protein D0Q02_17200 [Micromonospora craniellae]
MKPGPLHDLGTPDDATGPPGPRPFPDRLGVTVDPRERPAVVAVGPARAGRADVLAALLDLEAGMLAVPTGSWLLLRHATEASRSAYVPGYRTPFSYRTDLPEVGPALARPPRRVELSLPSPLLRRFRLIDTPDIASLGRAGTGVLLDAAGRAGALLFVIAADQSFSADELHLLAEIADSPVQVFFAVTPGTSGWVSPEPSEEPDADPVDPVAVTVEAHRATLLTAVPSLAEARWLPVVEGDALDLRRALGGWASDEELHRSSLDPPDVPGMHGRVPVLPEPGEWSERLDRQVRSAGRRIRQHLALELAKLHLRVVQEIVFGAGCAGLPQLLDREMETFSLLATAQCDHAVRELVEDIGGRLFGVPLPEGVRRRITKAVRWGMSDHVTGPELQRVLLVTSTAGVASLTGAAAVDALASYPTAPRTGILPPVAVSLAGGCWQHWRTPGNADQSAARAWSQRALREIELELSREITRRFEVVRLSLGMVLSDAAEHGILLA